MRRREDARVLRAEPAEVVGGTLSHGQIAVERAEEETRAGHPEYPAQSAGACAKVAIAAVEHGHSRAPAGPERPHQRNGMPARYEHDVRAGLEHRTSDLGDIESAEAPARYALARPRVSEHPAAVALGERDAPAKGAPEADALLLGRRLGRIEHGEVERGALRRDVAEPRRVVLHRMRHDDGQARGRRQRAHAVASSAGTAIDGASARR